MSDTSFLYPFLSGNGPASPDQTAVRVVADELAAAARASWAAGEILDQATLRANDGSLDLAVSLVTECSTRRGRVFVIGNGGSACDARRLVRLLRPSIEALALLDPAVVTAVANDVGTERVFARQIDSFVRLADVVIAFTTSGTSPNILGALAQARRRGAHTIVFTGYGGAALPANPDVDVCLSVESSSVHRIQEAQGALTMELVSRIVSQLPKAAS